MKYALSHTCDDERPPMTNPRPRGLTNPHICHISTLLRPPTAVGRHSAVASSRALNSPAPPRWRSSRPRPG
eukprot:6714384-Prymnesium_polylepis.1